MIYIEMQFEDGYIIRREYDSCIDYSLDTDVLQHGDIVFVHVVVDL